MTIWPAMLLAMQAASAAHPVPVPGDRPGAVAAPAARPGRGVVLAAVRAEWPRHDPRGTGRLGPLEFSTWVMEAHGASVASAGVPGTRGMPPVSAMNAAARAFAQADANHDGGVTPDEMADFLLR